VRMKFVAGGADAAPVLALREASGMGHPGWRMHVF